MIRRIIANIIIGALALYIVSLGLDSMQITSVYSLITLSIVLGFLNATIKPLLKLLSLPITFITLGLFSLVINAVVLKFAFSIVSGVYLSGFMPAIWASILLSICNWVLYKVFDVE
ncbi:phage holin family protein [Romboutsia sp.]|uniref:phage holin family protein n=1 Tax=Romboutsia sp. TaxID=1965302 RepID=UPI003F3323F2